MLEELARAAWAENMRLVSLVDEAGGYCLLWDDETDGLREDWRSLIRAILKRLRNPTDEMLANAVEAGHLVDGGFDDVARAVWQAMIDSILRQEEASEQSTPPD